MLNPKTPFWLRLQNFWLLLFLQGQVPLSRRSEGAIIPPQWANATLNPCASQSWQLLHWPEDSLCYSIFTQGPCGETQEFYFDEIRGEASCRCSRGSSWHSETRECYKTFSKGPCGRREYFAQLDTSKDGEVQRAPGYCQSYQDCPPGHLFWPTTGKCFLHLSRGPCVDGHLLYINPKTGSTECGCNPTLMETNHWPHGRLGGTCHELFTKGPCVEGHIFLYNLTTALTECVCDPHLVTNYHRKTERCFELETTGPCQQGQIFTYDSILNEATCSCLPGYLEWLPTGACYRSFTRGPCPPGKFVRPYERKQNVGYCAKSSCAQGDLFHPASEKCYSVGRRGPCPRGQLWVFERATSVRGSCHCDPHLIGYWEPHGICYELGEQGPCPKRKVLSYERSSGDVTCRCDFRRGFVPWVKGRCIKAGVRRTKLVPVAGPQGHSLGSNSIQAKRVHRGLTLPFRERISNVHRQPRAGQRKVVEKAQEEILKDVLATILHNASINALHTDTGSNFDNILTGLREENLQNTQIKNGPTVAWKTKDPTKLRTTKDLIFPWNTKDSASIRPRIPWITKNPTDPQATNGLTNQEPTNNPETSPLRTRTEMETETSIHRITVSRSVTSKRQQWTRAPRGSRRPRRFTRRVTGDHRITEST